MSNSCLHGTLRSLSDMQNNTTAVEGLSRSRAGLGDAVEQNHQ